ncbi:Clp protease N-terminal domain-containing protein [Streptomyces clavuligerus]|uniref:Clp R domain-containing protein n=4 Tax=Streptomyces clavuligerus TaxID=1901 RepID=B5GNW8_STRCL|nr:Clp protease N-terminal domain-containing protein [Streptomyces clavuligerus]ANW18945.1 hypothetical protein BB341_12240 [Streptomyces clavuligerus]AXU13524.1 hypothetical protein D1794_12685 [Streptomyces clavuligerus]EDY48014.1 hypothetical protein SSCG_01042 [Streptomyces clavuligerus]EFG08343.1 Hypothetical protein SCLAV_3272 [Streptomyces clavuligerus]MBY6303484.1 hypothetical protein [Streptomyces clavuligerus]
MGTTATGAADRGATSDEGDPVVEIGLRVSGVLGAAWGAVPDGGDIIGTEQLLMAIAGTKSPAGRALIASGATLAAQSAVVTARETGDTPGTGSEVWESGDDRDASVPSTEVLGDDGDTGRRLSGAAARALVAALERARREGAAKLTAEHVLRGLLADGESRATETLRICHTSPERVARRLDGGDPGPEDDGLDQALWPTRDLLLRRERPRDAPFFEGLVLKLAKGGNMARLPAYWITLDCREQARRLAQPKGTEHVLLSVLATHEVALAYPHMAYADTDDAAERFAGGARLLARGLDYALVRQALEDRPELGEDDRDADACLDGVVERDGGTGPLVDALLRGDTRARRLLELLLGDDSEDERGDEARDWADDLAEGAIVSTEAVSAAGSGSGGAVEGTIAAVESILNGGIGLARRVGRTLFDTLN